MFNVSSFFAIKTPPPKKKTLPKSYMVISTIWCNYIILKYNNPANNTIHLYALFLSNSDQSVVFNFYYLRWPMTNKIKHIHIMYDVVVYVQELTLSTAIMNFAYEKYIYYQEYKKGVVNGL